MITQTTQPTTSRDAGINWKPSWIKKKNLQQSLGLFWTIAGCLQLQPFMFSHNFIHDLAQNTMQNTAGIPNFYTSLIQSSVIFFLHYQLVLNIGFAVLQIFIGLALLFQRAIRFALVLSIPWALVVWVFAQAFGFMIFPQSSMAFGAPGSAILYVIVAFLLWPSRSNNFDSIAASSPLGIRGGIFIWSFIWDGTALLELEKSNWAPHGLSAQLSYQSSISGIHWLSICDHYLAQWLSGYGTIAAFGMLLIQLIVGQASLAVSSRKIGLGIGILLSGLYWIFFQNFGSIFTGTSPDVNSGPLFILFALILWPRTKSNSLEPSLDEDRQTTTIATK